MVITAAEIAEAEAELMGLEQHAAEVSVIPNA
jgi:hypothetical protein